jgi:hypothetical protein
MGGYLHLRFCIGDTIPKIAHASERKGRKNAPPVMNPGAMEHGSDSMSRGTSNDRHTQAGFLMSDTFMMTLYDDFPTSVVVMAIGSLM